MFLHEDKELFKDVIEATAESQSQPIAIVEKDYYVTMILKLLSEEVPDCVFKGGIRQRNIKSWYQKFAYTGQNFQFVRLLRKE